MISVIISNCGGVGKTTIAQDVCAIRPEEVKYKEIGVKTECNKLAQKYKNYQMLSYKNYMDLFVELFLHHVKSKDGDIVLDISGQRVYNFLEGVQRYKCISQDIDFFIIPIIPDLKIMRRTIEILKCLIGECEVPPEMIKVILNRVDPNLTSSELKKQFQPITDYMQEAGVPMKEVFTLRDAYDFFQQRDDSLLLKEEVFAARDYDYMVQYADNAEEKLHFIELHRIQRLGRDYFEDCQYIYESLVTEYMEKKDAEDAVQTSAVSA
ncbi:hypothetical protein WCX49_09165 [Sulfurimonas sp. HSL-1656]|uniref:hypothetical protein n=1 Tax=Thiomicrolovo subterrani TaxID=3131934 RepID=UPI0031F92D72